MLNNLLSKSIMIVTPIHLQNVTLQYLFKCNEIENTYKDKIIPYLTVMAEIQINQ